MVAALLAHEGNELRRPHPLRQVHAAERFPEVHDRQQKEREELVIAWPSIDERATTPSGELQDLQQLRIAQ